MPPTPRRGGGGGGLKKNSQKKYQNIAGKAGNAKKAFPVFLSDACKCIYGEVQANKNPNLKTIFKLAHCRISALKRLRFSAF